MKSLMSLVIAACVFTFASCGGGGGSSSKTAQIRFGNFVTDATSGAQVLIDTTSQGSIAFGQGSGYITVDSGNRNIEMRNPTDSVDFINQTISLNGDAQYTFLASGVLSDQSGTLFTDNNAAPSSGNVSFRFINASKAIPNIDVYLDPTAILFDVVPDVPAVGYKTASSYLSKPAGAYRLRLTAAGLKTPRFDGGTVTYSTGQIRTFVIFDSTAGLRVATLNDLN